MFINVLLDTVLSYKIVLRYRISELRANRGQLDHR